MSFTRLGDNGFAGIGNFVYGRGRGGDHLALHAFVMLIAIDRYAHGVFDPDDVRVLVAAFDDAWRRLLDSGVAFESEREAEAMRDRLAKYIIDQARHGERDQRRLREGALLHAARLSLNRKPGR
jgi:hypothetical protein